MRVPSRLILRPSAVSALLAVALLPASAFAAGMPQLEFTNWLVQGQVIWGAGIFLIFYLALHFLALPKIGKTLERRSSRIKNDLNLAHETKASADQAEEEMKRVRDEALAKARLHIQTIQESARAASAKTAQESSERLAAARREALTVLQKELEDAFAVLPEAANQVAAHITERLVPELPKKAIDGKLATVVKKQAQNVEGCMKLC